eukprot:1718026-Rhodomonas_salina.1
MRQVKVQVCNVGSRTEATQLRAASESPSQHMPLSESTGICQWCRLIASESLMITIGLHTQDACTQAHSIGFSKDQKLPVHARGGEVLRRRLPILSHWHSSRAAGQPNLNHDTALAHSPTA